MAEQATQVNGVNGHVNGHVNGDVNGRQHGDETFFEAIIVGAGFAGLRELYELRKRGVHARVFDAAGGIGGVSLFSRPFQGLAFLLGKSLTWLSRIV
jgi:NADPH-dependent glutamate synthase beta subunit-like oxidoreductase